MKLHFYRFEDGTPNFGDDLNAWLWPRLLPGLTERCPDATLIGFGTLLNDSLASRTPGGSPKLVFGAGVGYGTGIAELDDTYRIYCVRGPLSAEALHLAPSAAITDGAMLVNLVYRPERPGGCGTAFMPHVENAVAGGRAWRSICSALNIHYIDPTAPVEEVLAAIARTDLLLTEAMHGAIVAEALRRPWVPLATSITLPFKWRDWCASLELPYRPVRLSQVWDDDGESARRPLKALKGVIRRLLAAQRLWWAKTCRKPSGSDAARFQSVMARLRDSLEMLRKDFATGRFESAVPAATTRAKRP